MVYFSQLFSKLVSKFVSQRFSTLVSKQASVWIIYGLCSIHFLIFIMPLTPVAIAISSAAQSLMLLMRYYCKGAETWLLLSVNKLRIKNQLFYGQTQISMSTHSSQTNVQYHHHRITRNEELSNCLRPCRMNRKLHTVCLCLSICVCLSLTVSVLYILNLSVINQAPKLRISHDQRLYLNVCIYIYLYKYKLYI